MILRRISQFVLAIYLVLIPTVMPFEAAGVQPLVINLAVSPGGIEPFEFTLVGENVQERVEMNVVVITQQSDGNLLYDGETYSPVKDWISLERNSVIVSPGQSTIVKGQVRVPFDAAGTYVSAIMVEPQNTNVSDGIKVRYRYAIRLVIDVQRPGLRPNLAVHRLYLEADEQMMPIAKAVLQNTSPLMFPVAAEMTIRDQKRALIDRVELLAGVPKSTNFRSINIYPGAELHLDGHVTKPMLPGDYELRLFLRYADGKQKIHTQMVTVTEGDFVFNEDTKYLAVNPDLLHAELRPGGADSQILELINNSNEPMLVEIGGRDVEPGYVRSIFENLQFELRGSNIVEIDPLSVARVVMTIRAPRESFSGGYYGFISATAFSQDFEFLRAYEVPIYAIVGQDPSYRAKVFNPLITTIDEQRIISVTLRNDSDIHIVPTGVCYLKNVEGEVLYSIPLSLSEGVQDILPHYTGLLVAENLTIPAGEYTAEVRVLVNGQQLCISEENISIQDEN